MSNAEMGTPGKRRSPLLRVLLWLVLWTVVIVGGVSGYAYYVAYSALPQLDGQLKVPGLSGTVKVTRDNHGVPTIEALTSEDLFFAQGFVTAQDRLWQMDMLRRYASGELSEILGDDLVGRDREQRVLGLSIIAKKSLNMANARERSIFEAYARGVNAYIAARSKHLPIEFGILGYAPKPWLAEDSLLILNAMVKDLNYALTSHHPLDREKILAKLGPELTADLYVNRSRHDRPPTVMREDVNEPEQAPTLAYKSDDSQDDRAVDRNALEFMDSHAVSGSNNWVVSGAHTVTGKPLLSNDMHLGHQMPNLWYEAHLRSGSLDVAGVTLPGMPSVVVGHNQKIAWGFTNVGPTVTDLYIENFSAEGSYQTPKGWVRPEHRTETIHVKGEPDVTVDVKVTRHGPIITELLPGESRQLALRWTLYDGLRFPFIDVNEAQNWEELTKAFSTFGAPGLNVVYADVSGNIGYHATGTVPVRAAGNGSVPVSGADDRHEWTSYIPFDNLPSTYNPPSGMIATANGRITPDGYPNSVSMEWEAPWRTKRIYQVLASRRKFSRADMLALQTDIYSEQDLFAARNFLYAIDHASNPSARARRAADLIRGWDGRMLAGSAAPTITEASLRELRRLLLEPKLGIGPPEPSLKVDSEHYMEAKSSTLSWRTYAWLLRSVWIENILLNRPKQWLPEKYPNYDELLTAAVDAAVSESQAPKDLTSWKWGVANAVEIQHPILGKLPIIANWSGPGLKAQSGNGYSVKAVTRRVGPSERFTADLADLDQSTLNIVTGQGGNFLSPYYMDQWKAWYDGTTFNLPFSPRAVAAAKTHQLTLEPRR